MAHAQAGPHNLILTLGGGLKSLCAGVKTESAQHIKPIHAYCAARLVLEGGFPPSKAAVEPLAVFTPLIVEIHPPNGLDCNFCSAILLC